MMTKNLDFSLAHTASGDDILGDSNHLKRTTWVSSHIHKNDLYLFQDGILSKLILTEALQSFIGGQFIATIILGFSFLERTIAGRLHFIGVEKVIKMNSEALLNEALHRKWLTDDEYTNLNNLRELRNPIVHFREHLADSRPEVRATIEAKTTTQMLESDAEKVLGAVINILNKTSI
jgi:hypothetical protein